MTALEGAAMRTECGSSTSLATDHCNVAAVDLLDECWFFKNVLVLRQAPKCADDAGVCSKENGKDQAAVRCPNRLRDESSPPLQRMPTLPPRLQRIHTVKEEAITSLKSCNPKLRHSLSSLDNYKSSSSSKRAGRDRPPRYIKLERSERYSAIQHYIAKEAYYRKIFKEKKWRSHSDLEYIEVQGFKDLGFVFDEEELHASLARAIPGLNGNKTENGENTARPYLSEAWRAQKSTPVMFRHVDKRSAEDMKVQLKFWARAVACNARQEF